MKRKLLVHLTQHYTECFIVEVEGESNDEMIEQVRELVQQEMLAPYTAQPRADDGQVAAILEISEADMQEIEKQFHCERERIPAKEVSPSGFDDSSNATA